MNYLLFVTYFPHLVAGPVLHHAQMMPQFSDPAIYRANPARIAAGLMLFALGLAKKIVVADGVAPYADSVFDAAGGGPCRPAPRPGWERWPTHCSSTSTSPAIRTWRLACR